jgi:2,5-dioxopentanoate dehydrogenase
MRWTPFAARLRNGLQSLREIDKRGDSLTVMEQAFELEGRSLLGQDSGAEGGAKFSAINAATSQPLEPLYHSASSREIDSAVRLASEAFPAFRRTSALKRAEFLRAIAGGIDDIVEQLAQRTPQETALPPPRVRSEAARTSAQLRLFASWIEEGSWVGARIDRADPHRQPLPKPEVRSLWRPLGPVAVFGASNFPLAFSVAGADTASAFATGNPVVAKAHPAHPGTAELVGKQIQRAVRELSMPAGTFSLLFDAGTEVGAALVRHPLIRAVGFTGSLRAGRALMDLAAARAEPIPVYAEMGSTNPVFILPAALEQRSAEIASGLHASITLAAGQFCTKPGLIFLPEGNGAHALLEELSRRAAATAAASLLTPQIYAGYEKQVSERIQLGCVQALAQGEAGLSPQNRARAALFETDARQFLRNPHLAEEVFGPSALVIHCGERAELLRAATELGGHLTATVHGTDDDLRGYRDLIEILETKAGRLIFNGYPTGVEVCHAMVHGGPYPATSDGRSTSVGTQAIYRFARLVCYQGFPDAALPPELQDANPLGIWRLVDGRFTREAIGGAGREAQGS